MIIQIKNQQREEKEDLYEGGEKEKNNQDIENQKESQNPNSINLDIVHNPKSNNNAVKPAIAQNNTNTKDQEKQTNFLSTDTQKIINFIFDSDYSSWHTPKVETQKTFAKFLNETIPSDERNNIDYDTLFHKPTKSSETLSSRDSLVFLAIDKESITKYFQTKEKLEEKYLEWLFEEVIKACVNSKKTSCNTPEFSITNKVDDKNEIFKVVAFKEKNDEKSIGLNKMKAFAEYLYQLKVKTQKGEVRKPEPNGALWLNVYNIKTLDTYLKNKQSNVSNIKINKVETNDTNIDITNEKESETEELEKQYLASLFLNQIIPGATNKYEITGGNNISIKPLTNFITFEGLKEQLTKQGRLELNEKDKKTVADKILKAPEGFKERYKILETNTLIDNNFGNFIKNNSASKLRTPFEKIIASSILLEDINADTSEFGGFIKDTNNDTINSWAREDWKPRKDTELKIKWQTKYKDTLFDTKKDSLTPKNLHISIYNRFYGTYIEKLGITFNLDTFYKELSESIESLEKNDYSKIIHNEYNKYINPKKLDSATFLENIKTNITVSKEYLCILKKIIDITSLNNLAYLKKSNKASEPFKKESFINGQWVDILLKVFKFQINVTSDVTKPDFDYNTAEIECRECRLSKSGDSVENGASVDLITAMGLIEVCNGNL